ncbi:MAG: hypothetical protein UT55_C0027G0002 [Candidatus Peregrinibacteria bacterium GW2011_GWE2_39_6]|nr:MAG: hypothetical protein UT36_C0003G0125 [Candidatus Peregrinibacteria bacterium GW2011_GWF2_39_17]KKR25849.1 MAG: hypothetical protein UT55_C0027G0002 [Candidatus Peregrinibacteria bacterium GW2011_GWE2_39_6]HCW32324.1 hypothetical protein [Candidatus Peregrinibacteria bacterium]
MPKIDIYSEEVLDRVHSLRYILILAKDVIGILNRITSLMRRNRYNMEEVSVSFDQQGKAHILIAIDGRSYDVNHAMAQLRKLYDVYDVKDVTHEHERLFNVIYVEVGSADQFKLFPLPPGRTVKLEQGLCGIFVISLEQTNSLLQFLQEEGYAYRRRLMGLI